MSMCMVVTFPETVTMSANFSGKIPEKFSEKFLCSVMALVWILSLSDYRQWTSKVPAKEIKAKIYAMGTKWQLADCIKEASKFQVASLQVATLIRLAVCEFECDYV